MIDEVGDDVLLMSTDYPHGDSKYPRAIDTFLARPELTGSAKRKALWDNPVRFYNLKS